MKTIRVEVKQDHLERLVERANPLAAVAELIWNAVDADASNVEIRLESNALGTIERIWAEDDGHGIAYEEALRAFKALGDSEKKRGRHSKGKKRIFHGEKGEGRFAAFAVGPCVRWTTCWMDGQQAKKYVITGTVSDLGSFEVGDPEPVPGRRTGTEVEVFNITATPKSLLGEDVPLRLAELFAVYLRRYPEIRIRFDGEVVDPGAAQDHVADYPIGGLFSQDGKPIEAELTVIEWKHKVNRELVLCDPIGCALAVRQIGRVAAKAFNFSAYLKSEIFRERQGVLDLEELSSDLSRLIGKAHEVMRDHFRKRTCEMAKTLVEQWKDENVYPYIGPPASPVEQVERQVFDVVALNVNEYLPDFAASNSKSKRFSFEMLKSAIESSPGGVRRIVEEFLDLPLERRQELIELLDRTSLDAIISTSTLVMNRLDFLEGLEVVLFHHDVKKKTKERRQLHRLLARNIWVFGEEFSLSVDDQSLNEVLKSHLKYLGRDPGGELAPVRTLDEESGIVDLMLSRQVPLPSNAGLEHLVVELKRPSQTIDGDAIQQVKKYAFAVAHDERFRSSKVKWTFWALSNKKDSFAEMECRQASMPPGMVYQTTNPNITIWVKTWGEVLDECKERLRFFRDKLKIMATHETGVEHLQKVYAKYLPDIEVAPEVDR